MSALATATSDRPSVLVTPVVAAEEPRQGDVVVEPEPDTPGHFTVRQVPGRPSMMWKSRDQAIEIARGFARTHTVDVWFGNGRTVARMHTYRSAARRTQ